MTSKLKRTIVGVGIALGAAPACFGQSHGGDDPSPSAEASDDGFDGGPNIDGDMLDASSDAPIDPFCDVSWPPTKGDPEPGRVACVDPLKECTDAWPPYRCYELLAPFTCNYEMQRVGPLHCIGGQWQCPPGTDNGSRCRCYGPLPAGQTCTDAGLMPADAGGGE